MHWEEELLQNITDISGLSDYFDINFKEKRILERVIKLHPMSITKYYLSLMNINDPNDPIRRMIIPSVEEMNIEGSYDTSGEQQNTKMEGVQHKYAQTVLLIATNRCASYCRHCFRKRMIGRSDEEVLKRFNNAVDYIKEHEEVTNILITGGDPLTLPTHILRRMIKQLINIQHLDYIRIGTRMPVFLPSRIYQDNELTDFLSYVNRTRKRIYIVTHFNHPREFTEQSQMALLAFTGKGVPVSNQTVLLKGVNDNADVLSNIMRNAVRNGIIPYYVFQCRPVKRVKNMFQLPIIKGIDIIESCKKQLDGHAKRFKYIMSHRTGKIEILARKGDSVYFKYHQARNPANMGRIFSIEPGNKSWIDSIKPVL